MHIYVQIFCFINTYIYFSTILSQLKYDSVFEVDSG